MFLRSLVGGISLFRYYFVSPKFSTRPSVGEDTMTNVVIMVLERVCAYPISPGVIVDADSTSKELTEEVDVMKLKRVLSGGPLTLS